ncbi:MAG TPA: hypothetical protein ENN03_01985 [bacterium]|nr:hypothetical protein [bacterium]
MNVSRSTLSALSLESFTALDLETTGLDSRTDEILEIGWVRWNHGKISGGGEELIRPAVSIPAAITRLTGIRNEDCRDRPMISDVLLSVWRHFEKGILVAHNASFDLNFLEKARQQWQPDLPPIDARRVIDTVELARILYPWITNHRLETLTRHLDIQADPVHRARADAEAAGSVFMRLVFEAMGLDGSVLDTILALFDGSDDELSRLFKHIRALRNGTGMKTVSRRKGPDNRIENMASGNKEIRSDCSISDFLGPKGLLEKILPGFECRKPQLSMAEQTARAFRQDGFLMAEAGTGVGKSMAYLVPAVLRMPHAQSKTIISTQTKTLQNQLFYKDIPLLAETSPLPFTAVLLKGRSNYLCQRRWEEIIVNAGNLSSAKRRQLLGLALWSHETRTGDVEECGGFHEKNQWDGWREVNSDGAFCRGHQCPAESKCFYARVRRAARKASLVVINHSLLFSDMAAGNQILGEFDTLIVDEAHQMERAASRALGRSLHLWMFYDLCRKIDASGSSSAGVLNSLQKELKRRKELWAAISESVSELRRTLQPLCESAELCFRRIEARMKPASKEYAVEKQRVRSVDELFGSDASTTDVSIHLKTAAAEFQKIMTRLAMADSNGEEKPESFQQVETLLFETELLKENWEFFTGGLYDGHVVWREKRKEEKSPSVHSVPLRVDRLMSDYLYPRLKRCLLTSATLSVAGSFDYMAERLGLNRIEKDRLTTRAFGSPFHYDEQVRLIVASFLPGPRDARFTDAVAEITADILSVHDRGTMVLFTSHQMLRGVYRRLVSVLKPFGIQILGQGIDGSRTRILDSFQKERRSVLLGTSSFWEGVDIPGEALEMLIIPKIPFDVPTDPVVQARSEEAHRETGNGFMNYSVPEAVVRLRQGFGRLIRKAGDRGSVICLDNRMLMSRYGAVFLESLPVNPVRCDSRESLMEVLAGWFETA